MRFCLRVLSVEYRDKQGGKMWSGRPELCFPKLVKFSSSLQECYTKGRLENSCYSYVILFLLLHNPPNRYYRKSVLVDPAMPRLLECLIWYSLYDEIMSECHRFQEHKTLYTSPFYIFPIKEPVHCQHQKAFISI